MCVNFLVHIKGDHSDDVNILGRRGSTIKENKEALVVASKEIDLELIADKTKYLIMTRDQDTGRIHDIKIVDNTFESLEQFRYLGTNLTNQNSIQEENMYILKSQNACYHSVQNLLSSSLLSKNINIKIYRTTDFLLFCNDVKFGQNKKTTRLALFAHHRNCYTRNQTLNSVRKNVVLISVERSKLF